MNWKQFGKAHMLNRSEYNQNVYMFMCLFEIHWRYWNLMVQISDANHHHMAVLETIEVEWNRLRQRFQQGLT